MNHYEERTFSIPDLKGMSKKSVEEHLKLYSGYVKNTNLIFDKIEELGKDAEKNAYVLGELQRRFSFEWNGMRNHEYYFASLERGASPLPTASALKAAIAAEWGSYEAWLARFKMIALTRGIGWAILYYDPIAKRLVNAWVDEQHLGQLNGARYVFGIDLWEHSFVFDYQPSGKKQYVEDFLANVNWSIIEANFAAATK